MLFPLLNMWTKIKKFFTIRSTSSCNKPPGEVMDSSTLETKDLAGQDAGLSCLNCVFAKKGWNR